MIPGWVWIADGTQAATQAAQHAHELHTPLSHPAMWGGFLVFMLVAMVVDLGLDRRSRGAMSTRAAIGWSVVWISLALVFNGLLLVTLGVEVAEEFLAGYLLEKSLSVDNLFVFVLVFAFFRTPPADQRRVLVWGILGAMILRAVMILLGAALIQQFHYTLAVFGVFLVYSGIKLLFHDDDEDPGQSLVVRGLRKVLPLTEGSFGDDGGQSPSESGRARSYGYRGSKFFVHEDGKWRCTTLFLVLLVIEGSDVVFAVDSVPAIFGVTSDPFIVFTSNMFAILGLRALFFVIAAAIQKLRYLNYGLSIVLSFIGVKMLLPFVHELALKSFEVDLSVPFLKPGLHISTTQSLLTICVVLGGTTLLSLVRSGGEEGDDDPEPAAAPQTEVSDETATAVSDATATAASDGPEPAAAESKQDESA